MTPRHKQARRLRRRRGSTSYCRSRLTLEILEDRLLLSAPAWPAWLVAQPAQAALATLDASQPLSFSANPGNDAPPLAAGVSGSVANEGGAGGVDWYSFTLGQASDMQLATFDVPGGNHLDAILSLFDSEAIDPYYPLSFSAPPYDPQQHRLLTQVEATPGGPPVSAERELAAGTYYVAVSGLGNQYFNPFLAGSGYAGSTGDYQLLVTATPLSAGPFDGPSVLAVDPGLANGATAIPVLSSSPLALYVDFSGPIDPTTVSLLQPGSYPTNPPPTVQLTFNPTGHFGDGNDSPVLVAGFHYATDAQELQLQIGSGLAPGFYRLTLAGNPGSAGNPVLTDPTDTINLGQDADHPGGQDFTTTFQIASGQGSHDTSATAFDVGDITQGGLVQAPGTIGNDPAYNPSLPPPDPSGVPPYFNNPASQVDLYHFQVSGPGSYDFGAEVFAGRIGSTLDAAVSLFRYDPSNPTSPLQLVASNDNSDNTAASNDNHYQPLFTDPVLDVGLTAGDYFLAVSSSGNVPSLNGMAPGTNGIFDPNVSHSGYAGSSTGAYVLNLLLQPAAAAPHVVATSIAPGSTLTAAPTQLTVTFDSHVNVAALANEAFLATSESTVAGVYFVGADGRSYFPRLQSYDDTTHQATFLLLDRLPNGMSQLHLSGASGLTGYGGIPLAGNDPSGDYEVPFTVADAAAPADPLNRTEQPPRPDPSSAQDLGVLFPHELQNGVAVTGALTASAVGVSPDSDTYTIQILQAQQYQFNLTVPPAFPGGPVTPPDNLQLTITDATGAPVIPLFPATPSAISSWLLPGMYTIQISRSSSDTSTAVPYQLLITFQFGSDNPPPLSIGATPVLQIRTTGNVPPPSLNSVFAPYSPPAGPPPGPAGFAPGPLTPANAVQPPVSSDAPAQQAQLVLRADPAGGVTSQVEGTLVAFVPPVQIQGLNNAPSSLAANPLVQGVAALTVLLVTPAGAKDSIASDGISPADSAGTYRNGWLDFWSRWLDSLPGEPTASNPPVPLGSPMVRVGEQQPFSLPTVPVSQTEASVASTAVPALLRTESGMVRPIPVDPPGPAPEAPLEYDTAVNDSTDIWLRWAGPFIAALAAFVYLRKGNHSADSCGSPTLRRAQQKERPI
jgi:hypothetical protein